MAPKGVAAFEDAMLESSRPSASCYKAIDRRRQPAGQLAEQLAQAIKDFKASSRAEPESQAALAEQAAKE